MRNPTHDPFAVIVRQLAGVNGEAPPKEEPATPKAKWVSRHRPGYMKEYMRKRRYRGMFDTPYTG